jgi:hypothetical protein
MRIPPVARLVPLVLVLGAPVSAQPQTAPHDPLEDATIRWGPFGFNPALVFRDVGRDTNVFNEAADPKSDFTATISPKLDVLLHPGPMNLTFTTTSDYVYYETYTSERGTNLGTSLRADFTFGAFKPFVTTGHVNTRDRLNREIDARARRQDQSYGAGARFQLSEGVFGSVAARQSKTTFDPGAEFRGQQLETTMNRTDDAIEAGGGVALTPLTTVQVTVSGERARFEFTPERNSETLRVLPTVSFSPLAILSGTASFGYRRFTGHSPQVPDYSGFVSAVTLATTVAERHRIEGTFGRDLQYSYDEAASEYVETGGTITWTWQIVRAIDSRVTAGRSRLHYRSPTLTSATDDDTTRLYGVSLGYHLNQNLRAGLNAEWRGRASERSADYAYDGRKVYASLTWGKQ